MLRHLPVFLSNRTPMGLSLSLGLAACALLTACSGGTATAPTSPVVPILAATVAQKDMPVQLQAIGSVEAYSAVFGKDAGHRRANRRLLPRGDRCKKRGPAVHPRQAAIRS